ncbi:hypothetical protein [Caldicellulosiruptor sp. DIB 104C]|uniref:hypothetical protein n=1 Tax=Caldicellulosiruptor sp. DIB 104C TaxID=3019889 RepID=UPI002306B62D|nr:hypothetical protein [Caldicellulosiruptor sp. DIB 104C]
MKNYVSVEYIKNKMEILFEKTDRKYLKLVSFLTLYLKSLLFIFENPEIDIKEKEIFDEWFKEKGKQYLNDLIEVVQKYGKHVENFDAVIDYYMFYLEDAMENNDSYEIIDWLYEIFKSVKNWLLERINMGKDLDLNEVTKFEFTFQEKLDNINENVFETCEIDAGFYLY